MVGIVVKCPVCGKRTWIRVQDGSYLNEYPIRINCKNCKALIKGAYIMTAQATTLPPQKWQSKLRSFIMYNAVLEECIIETPGTAKPGLESIVCRNADYVAEISGELPCCPVYDYQSGYPGSIYLRYVGNLKSETGLSIIKNRLSSFLNDYMIWEKTLTAFQLLEEGSFEYLGKAINEKLGNLQYPCNHYLQSFHCLQEVVLGAAKHVFQAVEQGNDQFYFLKEILDYLTNVDRSELRNFIEAFGGISQLENAYRNTIGLFCSFMQLYPHLLPAEAYLRIRPGTEDCSCISTCSFSDIKSFYLEAYETLCSLMDVPVCLDNILFRNGFQYFDASYNTLKASKNGNVRNYSWYKSLDTNVRIEKYNPEGIFQGAVNLPITDTTRLIRNGIGHNNYRYDGILQEISVTFCDRKTKQEVTTKKTLMEMAAECIRFAFSSVMLSEIVLFMLREEYRQQGITSLVHPSLYAKAKVNDKCPCGSGQKYKNCCQEEYEKIVYRRSRSMDKNT